MAHVNATQIITLDEGFLHWLCFCTGKSLFNHMVGPNISLKYLFQIGIIRDPCFELEIGLSGNTKYDTAVIVKNL